MEVTKKNDYRRNWAVRRYVSKFEWEVRQVRRCVNKRFVAVRGGSRGRVSAAVRVRKVEGEQSLWRHKAKNRSPAGRSNDDKVRGHQGQRPPKVGQRPERRGANGTPVKRQK